MKVEGLTCPNCGAPVHRTDRVCHYCGSGISITAGPGDIPEIRVIRAGPAQELAATVSIPLEAREHLSPDDLAELMKRELSRKLAEGLFGYTQVKFMEDPVQARTLAKAKIRVIPPDYGF